MQPTISSFKSRLSRAIWPLITLLALTITGCSTWVPNEPIRIPSSAQPASTFESIMSVVRELGYEVKTEDKERKYVQIVAELDKGQVAVRGFAWGARAVQTTTLISVSIKPEGVEITAAGFHVREDGTVMKVQLRKELDRLAGAIARSIGSAVKVTGTDVS